MDIFVRFMAFLLKFIGFVTMPLLALFNRHKNTVAIPPIKNALLNVPVVDLAQRIRDKEITSEEVVRAYIGRIKEVNPLINAVVEDRFDAAIEDAKRADIIVQTTPKLQLITNHPILGVPFTVKESCKLKDLSYSVGSLQRKGIKASEDGETVALIKAAGGIPLLVSNTPEYCTSWECSNLITGRALNPYDRRRTAGGSSGGEGALNGCGATPFGIGSDIAGSIRVPALFNGIFGHKPTARALSIKGHFPMSSDDIFADILVVGPMCRYAKDLPLLLQIMAGPNAPQLRLNDPLNTKDIKIYFKGTAGFSLVDIPVQAEIKRSMQTALQHFRHNGLDVKEFPFGSFQDLTEMCMSKLCSLVDVPLITKYQDNPPKHHHVMGEIIKSIFGKSQYSFAGLFFVLFYRVATVILQRKQVKYSQQFEMVRQKFLEILGDNGVLFYPTYPVTALRHTDSFANMMGVSYPLLFNALGFPSTHVTLGKDRFGLPVGFQVIAAPHQDRLCLCIAAEVEAAFGGWKFP